VVGNQSVLFYNKHEPIRVPQIVEKR